MKEKKPHSEEAERAVLGSILLDGSGPDGDRVWEICQQKGVAPDWFYDPRNREIYTAMQNLARESKPLDHVSVGEALREKGTLEGIGGAAYIAKLYDQTPTTANAEYYIHILHQKHLRRVLIDRCTKAIELAQDETRSSDAVGVVGMVQKDLFEIDAQGDAIESWDVTTDKTCARLGEIIDGKLPEGLDTGLKEVDDILLGLKPGEMIVIGARPSVGKTALAMSIAEHLAIDNAEEKVPILIFSLEMNRESLSERIIVGRAELDRLKLKMGYYHNNPAEGEEAKKRLKAAQAQVKAAPLYVMDSPEMDIMQIRSIARRKVKHEHVQLVIIDYLTLCHYRDLASTQSRYNEVSLISNHIKAMAKELNVPVIVLSQLSRKASDRGGEGPGAKKDGYEPAKMSDLRESGSIEQDADVVLLLNKEEEKYFPFRSGERRPKEVEKELESRPGGVDPKELNPDGVVVETINIAKNRNGATGRVQVLFNRARTRFFDRKPAPVSW